MYDEPIGLKEEASETESLVAKVEEARRLRHSAKQLEAEDEAMWVKHGLGTKGLRKENLKVPFFPPFYDFHSVIFHFFRAEMRGNSGFD